MCSIRVSVPAVVVKAAAVVTLALALPATAAGPPSLGSLAAARGVRVGAAVSFGDFDPDTGEFLSPFHDDTEYRKVLGREFTAVVAENVMKMDALQPEEGVFDFTLGDEMLDFAEAQGMAARGHVLVWEQQLPAWVERSRHSRASLRRILKRHVQAVARHFAGRIESWDVVNEALDHTGALRDTIWAGIGKRYVKLAFRWARKADPDARLCYNDYNHINSEGWQKAKSDAVYELVRGLRKGKRPLIDCVGFQLHLTTESELQGAAENLRRYADLGVDVYFTEVDVRMPLPGRAADIAAQARLYRQLMELCLQAGNCRAFTMWGFTDRYSWIPQFFPGQGAALVFDERYRKKKAYKELVRALR